MKKSFIVALILFLPTLTFSQNSEIKSAFPVDILSLNEGIYMTMDEFLTNSPSIPYHFEVFNSLDDYYSNPEERNTYFLSYRDDMGYRKLLAAREIWGYCDGNSVFISFQGRPYEIVQLGAVSIIRYQQQNQRNTIAQMLSLYVMGNATANLERAQDILFHLSTGKVIIPTSRNIRNFISGDAELYADYKRVKDMDYFEKNLVYLQKYNEKYPLVITTSGISTTEPPAGEALVENKPI